MHYSRRCLLLIFYWWYFSHKIPTPLKNFLGGMHCMNTMTANCKKLAIVCHDMTVKVDFFQVLCVLKNPCSVIWISYFLWYESFRVFIDCRAFCRAYHWGENSVHFFSSVEVGRIHIQQNNTERGNYWIFIVTAPRRPRKAAILSVMKSKAVTKYALLPSDFEPKSWFACKIFYCKLVSNYRLLVLYVKKKYCSYKLIRIICIF